VLHVSPADRSIDIEARAQATFCATLVDQWVRDGVTNAMVAPGSRSTPMALALAANQDVRVEMFHDERSAGFAALGSGLCTGRPAVVLCTSGTAATHLHGAVVEAHLSGIPMLIVTADRPPELHDIGAPQTIDQTRLYGAAVRWFHDPGVPSARAVSTWRSLARHAMEATLGTNSGPVHLNLPFREPLVAEPNELPPAFHGPVTPDAPAMRLGMLAMAIDHERGVIVAGRGVDDPAAVTALSAATGWPVLADPRSGCRLPGAVAAADVILRHEDFALSHRPDVIVHLGEPPASKIVGQWIAAAGGVQVHVGAHRNVIDPAYVVGYRVVAPIGEVCRRLAGEVTKRIESPWARTWARVSASADAALAGRLDNEPALTEPGVARVLSRFDGDVVVASSMPVRDLEWFGAPDQRATVWSNRGANGIDGTIATAIGLAATSRRPVAVLVGDVALLHDSSSLIALASRNVDVRVVVIDNDGGGIFSFLPQATSLAGERFEQLFGTPHGTDLVALAAAHGLPAATVNTRDELVSALAQTGSRLIRVRTDRIANVNEHASLNAAVIRALSPS
jgi:2-succinyl-5-enolpyruvyl-6-hydroxy-3-cyclohexene-1-carboxylate synthase